MSNYKIASIFRVWILWLFYISMLYAVNTTFIRSLINTELFICVKCLHQCKTRIDGKEISWIFWGVMSSRIKYHTTHWKTMDVSGEHVAPNFQNVNWFSVDCNHCCENLKSHICSLLIVFIATFKLWIFITVTKDHRQTSFAVKWNYTYAHISQEWKKPSTIHKILSHLMFQL
jgi:hypothetical protein